MFESPLCRLFCSAIYNPPSTSTLIFPFRVQVVVLDEAIVVIYRLRESTSTVRRPLSRAAGCCFFGYRVAGVDPVRVDIDRRGKIWSP
jgi:hypothetical protein